LTAGSKINVVVSGFATAAVDDGSVTAAGLPLVLDNTAGSAPGRAELQKAGALAPACGVTLTVPASNKAEVWVYKQF